MVMATCWLVPNVYTVRGTLKDPKDDFFDSLVVPVAQVKEDAHTTTYQESVKETRRWGSERLVIVHCTN